MLTLTQGASSVVVAPEHGAALVGWMLGSTPILRRALPQAVMDGNPHAMGCFPLLPYCNRIGQSRFVWDGREYILRRNFGDHPHTLHGIGWQRAWTVARAGAQEVVLTLDHSPDQDWPFAFNASVSYTLSGDTLVVRLHMVNRHHAPAPAGIGLHPFFPRANDPALRFNATGAWQNGRDALPARHGPLPPDWVHAEPRPVAMSRLDNCFTGWDGAAEVLAGPTRLRIEADGALHTLHVFTPSWAAFFCVEPVSHIPDAINHADLPPGQAMTRLLSNQALTGAVRVSPTLISGRLTVAS